MLALAGGILGHVEGRATWNTSGSHLFGAEVSRFVANITIRRCRGAGSQRATGTLPRLCAAHVPRSTEGKSRPSIGVADAFRGDGICSPTAAYRFEERAKERSRPPVMVCSPRMTGVVMSHLQEEGFPRELMKAQTQMLHSKLMKRKHTHTHTCFLCGLQPILVSHLSGLCHWALLVVILAKLVLLLAKSS